MSTTFFGLAVSGSMFNAALTSAAERGLILRLTKVTPEAAKAILNDGFTSCCNSSHVATLNMLKSKHGIEAAAPEKAPFAVLNVGDKLLLFQASGCPRETREYTEEEVAKATFTFQLWEVLG